MPIARTRARGSPTIAAICASPARVLFALLAHGRARARGAGLSAPAPHRAGRARRRMGSDRPRDAAGAAERRHRPHLVGREHSRRGRDHRPRAVHHGGARDRRRGDGVGPDHARRDRHASIGADAARRHPDRAAARRVRSHRRPDDVAVPLAGRSDPRVQGAARVHLMGRRVRRRHRPDPRRPRRGRGRRRPEARQLHRVLGRRRIDVRDSRRAGVGRDQRPGGVRAAHRRGHGARARHLERRTSAAVRRADAPGAGRGRRARELALAGGSPRRQQRGSAASRIGRRGDGAVRRVARGARPLPLERSVSGRRGVRAVRGQRGSARAGHPAEARDRRHHDRHAGVRGALSAPGAGGPGDHRARRGGSRARRAQAGHGILPSRLEGDRADRRRHRARPRAARARGLRDRVDGALLAHGARVRFEPSGARRAVRAWRLDLRLPAVRPGAAAHAPRGRPRRLDQC